MTEALESTTPPVSLRGLALAASLVLISASLPLLYGNRAGVTQGQLRFSTRAVAPAWCPSGRGVLSQVAFPNTRVWATDSPSRILVLIDDVPAADDAFRVTDQGLTVCLPRGSSPTVMAFGLDTAGRPLEFDSSDDSSAAM